MPSTPPLNVRIIPGTEPVEVGAALDAPASLYAALLRQRFSEAQSQRERLDDTPERQPGSAAERNESDPSAQSAGVAENSENATENTASQTASDTGESSVAGTASGSTQAAASSSDSGAVQAARASVGRKRHEDGAHAAEDDSAEQADERHRREVAPVGQRKLTPAEVRFARVTEYLLNQVSDFCSDRTVLENGNWQMQMQLDPDIMPGSSLHLSLSGFELMLRFDTSDPVSKALISKHAGTLKQRLTTLLEERGTPREIEIVSA